MNDTSKVTRQLPKLMLTVESLLEGELDGDVRDELEQAQQHLMVAFKYAASPKGA